MSDRHDTAGSAPDALRDELVAYLDGELDPEASRQVEVLLSEDLEFRRRLQQHQQAWDMLDELPLADVDDTFTQTTVEMVAVSAADDVERVKSRVSLRQRLAWLLGGASVTAAAVAGYVLVFWLLSAPNRQLVEDLPVIENLDAYRHAESIEFLHALEREGLFTVEVEDAP